MESILSVLLGLLIAWTILTYVPVRTKVSYYTLSPWPLELDNSNLALIGVGLASPVPKPSVMDATPVSNPVIIAQSPAPVMSMGPAPMAPMSPAPMVSAPVSMSPAPVMVTSPAPVSMSPISITPGPAPSA